MCLKNLDSVEPCSNLKETDSHLHNEERKFNHFIEPTVSDRPEIVDAILEALRTGNDEQLSSLVCLHGLPPNIRPLAWPVLLRNHPYVKEFRKQTLKPETQEEFGLKESEIPHNRIRNDILRWCRNRQEPDLLYTTIAAFLMKYGRKYKYENQMVWLADFLLNGDRKTPALSPRRSPVSSPIGSPRSAGSFSSGVTPFDTPIGSPQRSLMSKVSASLQAGPENPVFPGVSTDAFAETFTNVMIIMNYEPCDFYHFISLLRTLMPELEQHFAYERVLGSAGGDVWLVWWLKWYGIRAMPPQLLCRLWDQYFSVRVVPPSVGEIHIFNCLMVVREHVPKLLEMDQSEIRHYLSHVPISMDIEAVVTEARALRQTYARPNGYK